MAYKIFFPSGSGLLTYFQARVYSQVEYYHLVSLHSGAAAQVWIDENK